MGSPLHNTDANPRNVPLVDVFAGMDQIKTGIAIYDRNLHLIFANQTIRGYLPHLYQALDEGHALRAAITVQTLKITPDMSAEKCEARADQIISIIRNCGSLEVNTPAGLTLKSTYDKTTQGLYVITTTDVSDHAAVQRALKLARQEADRANAAKSQFLANMSHEIRTPMSGVFMAAQLLQRRLRMANLTEMGDMADILVGSANHLSAILNDILSLSKIEAGQIDLHTTENSLADMLATFKKSQDYVAKEIGLDLKLVIDPKLPDRLIYDSVRLTQCVTNLVTNALKFTASGSVTVAVLFDPQTYVVTIHVVDTGMGIAPNEQDHVFGQFGQVAQDAVQVQKGTGLGLTISRQLARLMGGDITLTSELGKGSIFTLTLTTEPAQSVRNIALTA